MGCSEFSPVLKIQYLEKGEMKNNGVLNMRNNLATA